VIGDHQSVQMEVPRNHDPTFVGPSGTTST
jgi:hypothetical protein